MIPTVPPASPPTATTPSTGARPLGAMRIPWPATAERTLIVNGDDFGLSTDVNAAILRAHREGILTSASLMVNTAGFKDAVALARATPTLAVGLHLALSGSRSTLPPDRIPDLVGKEGCFPLSPAAAGWRYFFSRSARRQLEGEIRAQLEKFISTGLIPDHVNGHHHLHMHPVIFPMLIRACEEYRIPAVRIVRDRLSLSWKADPGRLVSRLGLSGAFYFLARNCARALRALPIRAADTVLGLYLDSRMTRERLLALIHALPTGTTEIYSHPSLGAETPHESPQLLEFRALVDPEVRAAIVQRGIRLTTYSEAAGGGPTAP